MAKIVGAFTCPHSPQIVVQPRISEEYARQLRTVHECLMEVRRRIRSLNADAIIIIGSDHMESFFLDNYPAFLIFVGSEATGRLGGETVRIRGHEEFARELLFNLFEEGYDLSFSQEMDLDHPYMVPLSWILKGSGDVQIIPFHVNSNVPPLPSPKRCYELGRAIARAIQRSKAVKRVVLIGTGGMSHFVGTPYYGKVDVKADKEILDLLKKGRGSELTKWSSEWYDQHGEFELRSWLTILGAIGSKKAEILTYEKTWHIGFCVASFKLDGRRVG